MNFLLNKVVAGKSLTRSQTATEASKLLTGHIELLQTYDALVRALGAESDATESVSALQRGHRDDICLLSEIILSSGGVPPRKASPPAGDDVDSLLRAANDGERSLRRNLEDQIKLKHHLRTIAVLKTLLANTERRIGEIKTMAEQLSLPVN